jgi:hypothetical protein
VLTCAPAWNSPAAKAEKNMIKNFFISWSFKEQLMLSVAGSKLFAATGRKLLKAAKQEYSATNSFSRIRIGIFRVKCQLSRLLYKNKGSFELSNAKSHTAQYYFGCQGLWRQAVQFHSWQGTQQ